MTEDPLLSQIAETGAKVSANAPLGRRTYWRVGGPARWLVMARTEDQVRDTLRAARAQQVPVFVLGNASNLLISDRGVPGIVLQLQGELADTAEQDGVLTVGAGIKLVVLLKRAERAGWTGLEAFAGIPGTVGGAVRMNAGQRLGETKDRLLDVDVLLPDGSLRTLSREDLGFAYRTCQLPEGAVVLRARFQLTGADPEHTWAHIAEHLAHRERTQPLNLPSCGSTFRNPPGDHAGRLIEASGLKGFAIGDAQVSTKHANFIVNNGAATAEQIRRVIEHVIDTVQSQHGVALEREVHYAGDWSHWDR